MQVRVNKKATKQGTRYYVTADLGTDETGKRIRQGHGGYATKAEAKRAAASLMADAMRGAYVEPNRRTLERYLVDEWLPARAIAVSPGTYNNNLVHVTAYIVPRIGNVRLQDLKAAHITRMNAELLRSGNKRTGGPLAPKSVQNVHRDLHKALEDAVRWGYLVKNPATVAEAPHASREPRSVWSPDQVGRFFTELEASPMRPIILFIATTGVRRGEAVGLRWDMVDLDAGQVSIVRTRSTKRAGQTKTKTSTRAVPLPPVTVHALRAHRAKQNEERLLFGAGYQDAGLVFAKPEGLPLNPNTVLRTFQRLTEGLELPVITLQQLRHTWATTAMAAGISPKVVQENLGHSSVQITLDIYSHVAPSLAKDATEEVARRMFGNA